MQFDENFIRQILSDASIYGTIPINLSFSIDSRNIRKDDIYVALSGQQCDGHQFVVNACKNGARGAIISSNFLTECQQELKKNNLNDTFLIVVDNPKKALIKLAIAWREQFNIPIIGVTGSVGKTFTKEMIAKVFYVAGKSYVASYGNQNTQIGVALNVLRLRSEHEVAVFEMGVNRRGEMALLAQIVKPTIAVITSVGHAHMEGLGSLQDIALEKRNIFKYFTENDIGIVNGDQPLLASVSYHHPVIKVGLKTTNQIQARKMRFVDAHTRCVVKLYKEKYDVVLSKPHAGAVNSALIAAAVGYILMLPHSKIIEAIQEPIEVAGRFERRSLKIGTGTMISDCYNANPESMKAALTAFQHIGTSSVKIAVLGDMLELGVNSPFWHRQIGRFFRKVPSLKKVILVGNLVEWVEKTLPINVKAKRVVTWQEAELALAEMVDGKDNLILVKGSNGVGLLNLVERCTK